MIFDDKVSTLEEKILLNCPPVFTVMLVTTMNAPANVDSFLSPLRNVRENTAFYYADTPAKGPVRMFTVFTLRHEERVVINQVRMHGKIECFDGNTLIHFQPGYSSLLFNKSVKYKLTLFHRSIKRNHNVKCTLFHG